MSPTRPVAPTYPQAGDGQADDYDLATLTDMVMQYQHRLLSLEAELHDRARSGLLSDGEFSRRARHLRELGRDLHGLAATLAAEAEGDMAGGDVGLPLMASCTPAEAKVCALYLAEKAAAWQSVSATAQRLESWLTTAMRGRSGVFQQIFRLSRLRHLILGAEASHRTLRQRQDELAAQVAALLGAPGSGDRQADAMSGAPTTLAALKALFLALDATTQRLARLTTAVKKEEARTQAMAAWIDKELAERAACRPAMEPPTPFALARAVTEGGHAAEPLPLAQKRRRALVEQFWQQQVGPRGSGAKRHALRGGEAALAAWLRSRP